MKILYFTATGNSLYIAKSLSDEIYSIPQLIKQNKFNFTNEKIGIIFPIYSQSVLPYIQEFLEKSKFNCNYLFAILTYGIYDAASPKHLFEIGNKNNIKFNYINTIKMVDTWLPGFKMESQIKNEHKKNIESNLKKIKNDIENNKQYIPNPSFIDNFLTNYQIRNKMKVTKKESLNGNKSGNGIKNFLTVENSCVKCGICTKVCPVNNIELIDDKIKLKDYCLTCFSCTNNCPTNSMRIKGERDKSRFRNSHTTIQEIIKSNIQK